MSSAAFELPTPPWRKPRKGGRARRPLSRDLIVETAQAVVRAEGLDGVSMRRVAQELGTGPASLYAHVSDKDELLELVADRIAGQIPLLEPDPDRWREQIRESARAARRVWRSYADICRVFLGRVPTGENQLRIAENHLAIVRAGGVPDRIAAWFVDRLALFITADVLEGTVFAAKVREGWDPGEYFGQLRGYFQSLPADRFPNIVSMVDDLMDADDEQRFEFGLELMIRGLASYVED
ncbi:TetR/AcrR family transcriptional regulator [Thermomonospora cellulosilytica]|uniref:AcrR family transcriptional regulator n=1 Tax=Thermomonospora cellulosilytica TaxID=1411118 RepID=A0A7W3R993_9ACTN|nr:TetR/AcrR family transcriptional regulator [Thermomonospora cellulosilytica]MBA9004561.1 AcrR family transcriptional regulator [Thermomonospora cellulosilytica]